MSAPTPKRVEAIWLSYREQVIPQAASSDQLRDLRRAFYAGAHGLLTEILRMLEPGEDATTADLYAMAAIHNELIAFNEKVKRGAA